MIFYLKSDQLNNLAQSLAPDDEIRDVRRIIEIFNSLPKGLEYRNIEVIPA